MSPPLQNQLAGALVRLADKHMGRAETKQQEHLCRAHLWKGASLYNAQIL